MSTRLTWLSATAILCVTAGACLRADQSDTSSQSVSDFDECVAAGNPIGESHPRQCWTPDGGHFVEELPAGASPKATPAGSRVTLAGVISCLPKAAGGPHTLECAIGIRTDEGHHYGLRNLLGLDPQHRFSSTGTRVEVSGLLLGPEALEGPHSGTYDIAGVIDLTAIRELPE